MQNIFKYLTIALAISLIVISVKYYFLSENYANEVSQNKELISHNALMNANISILKQSIDKQNKELEERAKDTANLTETIENLNKKIEEYNNRSDDYISMKGESNSSEEAILWMQKQAPSLLR